MDDTQCRVCLEDASEQVSVFTEINGISIDEQLFSVTTVQILETDSLSKMICKSCCVDTSTAFSLKIKCLSTDKTLRNLELKFQTKLKEMEAQLLMKQSLSEQSSSVSTTFNQIADQQEQKPDFFEVPLENSQEETEFTVAYIDDVSLQCNSEEKDGVMYGCEDQDTGDNSEISSTEIYEEVEYLESDAGEEVCSVASAVVEVPENESEKPKNICHLCDTPVLFKHEFSLKRHLWTFHENVGDSDPMVCETCSYRFDENPLREDTLIRAIQKHQDAHENGKTLCCTHCPELFKSKLRLDQHIEEHKKRSQSDSKTHHKCRACHKSFPRYEELISHLNRTDCREAHERPFKCFICNVSFSMGKKKKEHVMREHHDKAGADCPLCCRCKIPSAVAFENHYSTHFEAPRFTCPYCSRPFFKSDRLQTHIRRSHEIQKFECNWCDKTFHDKGGISRHILGVHFNRRNYQCDVCNKLFTENYNLKEHKFSVHKLATKFYTCSLCLQNFLYRAPFERHKKMCMGPEKRSKDKTRSNFIS